MINKFGTMKNNIMPYKIKIAGGKDAKTCVKLSMESWPEWWSRNMRPGEMHIKECIKQNRSLIAVSGGRVVAYCVWGRLWNKIHLQDIFVKEKCRRTGLASRLFENMKKIAKKQGIREIMSDCDIDNEASIGFHLKNGFKKCGYIKNNWARKDSLVFSMKI